MRNMIFVSHANPEDNEFTLWLALQLAKEGYPVWCDLTKLLGGEDFWRDIEQAIRERTVKFLYVLSRTSNTKDGPLQELHVAKNVARDQDLHDFIIPVLIDDLPHRNINIQLSRLNAILFTQSWAKGLSDLLDKLDKDSVDKNSNFSPQAVSTWWRSHYSSNHEIIEQSDEYLSNWFPITNIPDSINFHILSNNKKYEEFPYPSLQYDKYIISFADDSDFTSIDDISIVDTYQYSSHKLINREPPKFINRKASGDFIYQILRIAWEQALTQKGLQPYALSDKTQAFFFSNEQTDKNRLTVPPFNGRASWRNIVNYSPKSKRYWHFAISGRPFFYPNLAYGIRAHVVFSDDGKTIWESKPRLHRARRSTCKNWWNAQWRDRILATMHWLAHEGNIAIPLGSKQTLQVQSMPMTFNSPVSYSEDHALHTEDFTEDWDEDE